MNKINPLLSSIQEIEKYFGQLDIKSFTEKGLMSIIKQNRDKWNITSGKNSGQVVNLLIKSGKISVNTFSDSSNESKLVYSWKDQDEFTVISGLKHNSYFSFYTALFLHQLSLQIPKTIYLNFEHKSISNGKYKQQTLMQEQIDNAFNGSQRKSSVSYSFRDKKIILTNGKNTGRMGVIKRQNDSQCFYFTDLERTLIDITVRPVYAGGVFEVLEAYKLAKDKLDVKKLSDYLSKLKYIYPYQQAIGFYLEKADYKTNDVELFRKNISLNFYLTYDIRSREFSEKWKLYYPKGF